jgi:hypothetical protein
VRRSVYSTGSFSVCSLRQAKFPIIYHDLRFDGSTTKLQHNPPESLLLTSHTKGKKPSPQSG